MNTRKNLIKITDDMIRIAAVFILSVILMIMLVAFVDHKNIVGEAPIGDYEVTDFSEGWWMTGNGNQASINLPAAIDESFGDVVILTNMIPDNVNDGMTMLTRVSLADIYIYVESELRAKYTSEMFVGEPKYIPSAYIAVPLKETDAGKLVRIEIHFKANRAIKEVTLGYGLNPWKNIITGGAVVTLGALMIFILGAGMSLVSLFLGKTYRTEASRNLGLLMIDIGIWMLSESSIRQIIFSRPSLARYFAYLSVEVIGLFACLFFDEVQHRKHHKYYVITESIVLIQVFINITLYLFGIAEFYDTLVFSHVWMATSIILAIVIIISDIRTGAFKEYIYTFAGMMGFIIMSGLELVGYYVSKFHQLGVFLSIGLLTLMMATVMQSLRDEKVASAKRERKQVASTFNTLEIIANSIDARDEYTGGHSERVGFYAMRLAREMAADYDLTEEDILKVHYIGLVHDIGKIGVAENVLNKAGRLTDEEFSLMKKHSEIGYEIMSPMGDEIKGLLEGIRSHHERFDGRGYPDGLSDTDIPLIARIMALADSYDAMTSNRVYRKRLSDEDVKKELLRCSGTQFDPALTKIFVDLIERGEMKVNTVDGLAVDKEGNVRMSAILEAKLQRDIHKGVEILNPNHIRMLCYIIKLMENKKKKYDIFFIDRYDKDDEKNKELDEVIKSFIGNHDVNIRYTEDLSLIALFDKKEAAIDMFKEEIIKVRGSEQWIHAL